MCQAGNDLPTPIPGFADTASPLAMGGLSSCCYSSGAQTVLEAAALLAQHVVARLVAAHAWPPAKRNDNPDSFEPGINYRVIERFVVCLIGPDDEAPREFILALRREGLGCEAICHDVLAPAARRLWALWHDDACDYAGCRLGLWRLRRLLDVVDHGAVCRRAAHRDPAAALFLTLGTDEDAFEHALVMRSFARSGWHTHNHCDDAGLPAALLVNRFHIAWISIGRDARLFDIASLIRSIRRGSCNRAIGIVCGGAAVDLLPAAWEVGADAVVPDARAALDMAERWRMWQAEDEPALALVA